MQSLKDVLQTLMKWYLRIFVGILRWRHKPRIVAITGSVGKTSTKEALCMALKTNYGVLSPDKSYNTPLGLLLGVLKLRSGFSSVGAWLKNLLLAPVRAFSISPAQIWVLEMGVDKPGDMDELLTLIHPNIGVFLNVHPIHVGDGQFANAVEIAKEKSKLILALCENETAVLNLDDGHVVGLAGKIPAHTLLWSARRSEDSMGHKAHVYAKNVLSTQKGIRGTFVAGYEEVPFAIPVMGAHHVNLFLPTIAVAELFGVPVQQCVEAFKNYHLPPGRMTVIPGQHGSVLLDSSYNASPFAMEAALQTLKEMPVPEEEGRKITVLGSMNELGKNSEAEHRKIGRLASDFADLLVCVGQEAKWYAVSAIDHGMKTDRVFTFELPERAGEFLQEHVRKGDTVFFKGSQNRVRLERAIKMVMAHPDQSNDLLVRQETEWQSIP